MSRDSASLIMAVVAIASSCLIMTERPDQHPQGWINGGAQRDEQTRCLTTHRCFWFGMFRPTLCSEHSRLLAETRRSSTKSQWLGRPRTHTQSAISLPVHVTGIRYRYSYRNQNRTELPIAERWLYRSVFLLKRSIPWQIEGCPTPLWGMSGDYPKVRHGIIFYIPWH